MRPITQKSRVLRVLAAAFVLTASAELSSKPAAAAENLTLLEEQALKAAVERVAPAVVRIETIGGLEQVGKVLIGTGPTTGLVVSSDGYIISSAFNFAQKPASILVTLADGERLPAKVVATDHNRMLVLLQVQSDKPLPVPEASPENDVRTGQWAVAVGRTFEGSQPNVSVGIVSAVGRIWGKALQTDAKISPSNYGGPLVDIRGRVLGVLVPMSPQNTTAMAGVEWYDSGIGFAVPLEHVLKMLPRLKAGEDLHPGVMGVSFKAGDQYADAAVIAACRANSPAYKAGLKAGDTIVEVDGQAVVRQAQVKQNVAPRYAGDTVKLAVLRGEERLERELTLVEKLQPYAFPFLGILPLRDAAEKDGVAIRYVYPDSAAAKAGLRPGDLIQAIAGDEVSDRAELLEKVAAVERGAKIELKIRRDGQELSPTLEPGALPESIPEELPPARKPREEPMGERPAVGRFEQKVPEMPNDCLVYVPQTYDPAVSYGVVVWLSADGSYDADALVKRWQPWCDRHDLILLAPQSQLPREARLSRRWEPQKDAAFIGKLLEQLRQTYNVDRTRVVVQGYQGGGALAYRVAFDQREWIRGIVAVDAPLVAKPPDNEPTYRLAFYLTKSSQTTSGKLAEPTAKALRGMMYPVTLKDLGEEARDLNDEEQAEVLRWIDTLDRI